MHSARDLRNKIVYKIINIIHQILVIIIELNLVSFKYLPLKLHENFFFCHYFYYILENIILEKSYLFFLIYKVMQWVYFDGRLNLIKKLMIKFKESLIFFAYIGKDITKNRILTHRHLYRKFTLK